MKHYTELMYMKWSGASVPQWDYRSALLARAAYSWGKLNFCVAPSWGAYIAGAKYENFGKSLDDAISSYNSALIDNINRSSTETEYPVLFVAFPDEDGDQITISLASVGITLPSCDVFAEWERTNSKAMERRDAIVALEGQGKL